MTINEPQESVSELAARLEAVSLDLKNMQLDLEGANDDLASAQEELEDIRAKLDARGLRCSERKAIRSTLDQFIAKNPNLDAAEMDELRFDRSPRGQYVYQHMMDDKHAPIMFSRRRFVVKDGHTEDEVKTYILDVFNTHTREWEAAAQD
ncbi:hypothetical protein EC957_008460 [Mortierella hygrophila]|uniref:Uncharacterized protein n=1 Tax=Mortierella hygrophila TaxID=979708 RepID=A0A9P6FDA8_9FUNG|nr:hypothetical protein EC957_008460 [Mortierella hygrophila]